MNQDLFLFIFALLLAFATGNISYLIKESQDFKLKDIQEINSINSDLQRDYLPFIRLDLNADYPTVDRLKLLQQRNSLSPTNQDIILNSSTCFKNKLQQLSSRYLDKGSVWMSYLCNQIERLPGDFFETPPYLHSNEKSYAYMFYVINRHERNIKRWFLQNKKYMHIEELKQTSWPTDDEFRFLYDISINNLERITNGEKFILTKNFYLIRTGNLKYFVLSANKAARNFKHAGLELSRDSSGCFIKAGNVCWKKKAQSLSSYLFETSSIIFFVTLIILVLTARALFMRASRKKKEDERKKHALRVLTHELRTPVSSLLLQIESLAEKSAELPDNITADITKIENEIYRLKHLAQKSKSYLQADSTELINTELTEFNLHDLCIEIKEEYLNTEINIHGDKNLIVVSDLYWLKMCLTNLIENAIRYGKAPIKMMITEKNDSFSVTVSDQGSTSFINLKQIVSTKHENTKGLGIGLLITQKTLKALGGSLNFTPDPTTFTITIKKRSL